MADALNDVRKLRDQVVEVAKELNLNVGGFSIIPGADGNDNDLAQITFFLTAEAVETLEETEKRKEKSEFEALMGSAFKNTNAFEDDATIEAAKQDKAKKLDMKKELEDLLEEFDEDDEQS